MQAVLALKVCLTREIDAAARAEIVAVCEAAHAADFQKLFDYLPEDGLHVIGAQAGQIVAHAVRTTRWAQPEGHPLLKTAYIDAVTTAVSCQGQGIGSALMRRMAEVIRGEDYLLSALETDKPAFYTRLGWEVWRGPLAGRRDAGLVPTPEAQGNVMILRLPRTPNLDVDRLLTIEDQGRFW